MNYALKSPAPVARRFAMRSSSNTSTMSPGQSATRSSRKANVTSLRLSTVSSSSKTNAASQPSTTAVLSVKIANTRDRTSENPNATRSSVDNTCPVALLRGDTNNASDESPWSRSALPMSHPGGDPLRMPAFRAQVGPKKVESSACDEDMVRMLAMPISPEERRLAQRHQKQQDDTSTSNPAPVSAIKTKSAMLSRVSSMITQTRRAFQVSAPSKVSTSQTPKSSTSHTSSMQEPSRATRLLRDAPASRVHNTPVSAPGKDKVSANKERLQREGRIAIVSSTRTVLPRAEKPSTPCERNARNVARRDAVSVESVESAKVGKENSITQEDKPGIASKEDNVQKPEIEKSQHRRKPLAPRPDLAHYGEVASFGQVGEWIMHADGGVYDDE
ncbi:hypothetical protein OBBRIDRAFT_634569 [Obba rivulosa]|uniref:Uncharacterized protein n=1 Tax=Obba rivulosa TaxID=1052685 RepID=A0A8E2DNI6_9APHY|nr:hypothetical protein OBBRIDRAFT_634569 [Obba rivulosa]